MKRREFITLLGSGGLAAGARAQQGERVRRIGVLTKLAADDPESQARNAGFLQGLQESSWRDRIGLFAASTQAETGHRNPGIDRHAAIRVNGATLRNREDPHP
jgi:hypothetical protein